MSEDQRELTLGEKAVGLTFNPSNDPNVQKLKVLYAEIIDLCDEQRNNNANAKGLFDVAINNAITAQMWAVKAITWK